MKKILLFLAVLFVFASCDKNDSLVDNPAEDVIEASEIFVIDEVNFVEGQTRQAIEVKDAEEAYAHSEQLAASTEEVEEIATRSTARTPASFVRKETYRLSDGTYMTIYTFRTSKSTNFFEFGKRAAFRDIRFSQYPDTQSGGGTKTEVMLGTSFREWFHIIVNTKPGWCYGHSLTNYVGGGPRLNAAQLPFSSLQGQFNYMMTSYRAEFTVIKTPGSSSPMQYKECFGIVLVK